MSNWICIHADIIVPVVVVFDDDRPLKMAMWWCKEFEKRIVEIFSNLYLTINVDSLW